MGPSVVVMVVVVVVGALGRRGVGARAGQPGELGMAGRSRFRAICCFETNTPLVACAYLRHRPAYRAIIIDIAIRILSYLPSNLSPLLYFAPSDAVVAERLLTRPHPHPHPRLPLSPTGAVLQVHVHDSCSALLCIDDYTPHTAISCGGSDQGRPGSCPPRSRRTRVLRGRALTAQEGGYEYGLASAF